MFQKLFFYAAFYVIYHSKYNDADMIVFLICVLNVSEWKFRVSGLAKLNQNFEKLMKKENSYHCSIVFLKH